MLVVGWGGSRTCDGSRYSYMRESQALSVGEPGEGSERRQPELPAAGLDASRPCKGGTYVRALKAFWTRV